MATWECPFCGCDVEWTEFHRCAQQCPSPRPDYSEFFKTIIEKLITIEAKIDEYLASQ